jgi:hypothetical protein
MAWISACLVIHLVHSIDDGQRQGFRGSSHSGLGVVLLTAGGGSHSLGLSLGGGVDHHWDPLHPERGLVPRLRYHLFSTGRLSMGLHSFLLLMTMPSLKREVSVRPWHCLSQWNHHHSLSGLSVLRRRYGCGGGGEVLCRAF